MKIKRGKKYLNANGDIVSITSKEAIGNMFHDKSGLSYQEDGHYRYDKTPSKFDLIKKDKAAINDGLRALLRINLLNTT